MIKWISIIVASVFNIAAVVLKAFGLAAASEVIYELLPIVNELVVAVFAVLGYQEYRTRKAHPQ
jgi:uncharacterized membrane protein